MLIETCVHVIGLFLIITLLCGHITHKFFKKK